MKERPILMTPENAQKCHDGTKTQTRRIIKPQPLSISWFEHQNGWCARVREDTGSAQHPAYIMVPCPYGVIGDRLWVREALYRRADVMVYFDGLPVQQEWLVWPSGNEKSTIPSIHMPRWACRTVLEITNVRVERVQDITAEDCQAEGVDCNCDGSFDEGVAFGNFIALWESINGEGSWERNDLVWVLSFRKVA